MKFNIKSLKICSRPLPAVVKKSSSTILLTHTSALSHNKPRCTWFSGWRKRI